MRPRIPAGERSQRVVGLDPRLARLTSRARERVDGHRRDAETLELAGECVELGTSVTRPVYGRQQPVVGSDEAFCAVVRLRLRGDQQQPRSVGQVLEPQCRWHWTSLSHRPPDRNVPPSLGSPPDDFQAPRRNRQRGMRSRRTTRSRRDRPACPAWRRESPPTDGARATPLGSRTAPQLRSRAARASEACCRES